MVSWIGGFVRGLFFKYFDGLVSINDLLREKKEVIKFFMLNGAKKYDVRNTKLCRSDALTELVTFSSQEPVCDFDFNSLHTPTIFNLLSKS